MEDIFRMLFQAVNASPMNYVYVIGAAGFLMAMFWDGKYGREIECGGWFTFFVATWTCVVTGIFLFSLDKLIMYADLIWTQLGSPALVQVLDLIVLAGFVLLAGLGLSLPKLLTRGGGVAVVAIVTFPSIPYYLGLALGPAGIWGGVTLAVGTTIGALMVAFPVMRPHFRKSPPNPGIEDSTCLTTLNKVGEKKVSIDTCNPLVSFRLEANRNPMLAETVIIMDCTRLQAAWVTPRLGGRVITLLGQGQARAAFSISYFLWNHYFRRLPGFETFPEEVDLPTLCGRAVARLCTARFDMVRERAASLFEGLLRVSRLTTEYFTKTLQDSRAAVRQVRQVHVDLGTIHSALLEWYEQSLTHPTG